MEERYFFYFEKENGTQKFQDFKQILEYCQKGIWPNLGSIVPIDENLEPEIPIGSMSDVKLHESFIWHQQMRVSMEINFTLVGDTLIINQLMDFWSKTILLKNSQHQFLAWMEEFYGEVQLQYPKFAYLNLLKAARRNGNTHFPYKTIVPHSGILSWLHYFSPAAIKEYNLQKLFENPHLMVTQVGEGHLFQVLEDPFEINTPEGEAKVIAANRWMLEHR